ncbi:hypothetical protein GALMADRAFT_148920 [Galerina marginata CBS 339.88]|uniref:Exonuclease domain-containing protein n=1 Tax=Galerina marginata (strain CBS 339.88) TaxID=685588 RepID=A0A067S309_GALM3|nr:hypothetical protein GALMADRAFT_148920 [Galerina marginata CBS 339.88]
MTDLPTWLKKTLHSQLQEILVDTIPKILQDSYILSTQSNLTANYYQSAQQDYICFYIQSITDRLCKQTTELAQQKSTFLVDSRRCPDHLTNRKCQIPTFRSYSDQNLLDIVKQKEISSTLTSFTYPFRLIFLDIETDGLDLYKSNILQISLLEVLPTNNLVQVRDLLTTYVKPSPNYLIDIFNPSTKIHGITQRQIDSAPTFKEIAAGIIDHTMSCIIVGYNIHNFDIPILSRHLHKEGETPAWTHTIDIAQAYWKHYPATLQNALRSFKLSHDKGHDAQKDAYVCIELFSKLIQHGNLPTNPTGFIDLLNDPSRNQHRNGKSIILCNDSASHPWLIKDWKSLYRPSTQLAVAHKRTAEDHSKDHSRKKHKT